MAKTVIIKLTKASSKAGPFNIKDQYGNIIASDVSKNMLISGVSYSVGDEVSFITLESVSNCNVSKTNPIIVTYPSYWSSVKFSQTTTSCMWRHLTNNELYNSFYGNIEPYILEYPYPFQMQDEILQSIKDFSRVYKYTPDGTGVFDYNNKAEVNDAYFSHLIIYNGQQNSGLLELVKKPKNNLSQYLSYPIYRESSKVITYTKSDSFYNINTFWNCLKDVTLPMFKNSCECLSKDKDLNQDNIDYSKRSFRKDLIRGKAAKVRYILNDRSDIHIVSKINFTNTQLSYK